MTDYDPLSNAEWRAFQAAQQFERWVDLAAEEKALRSLNFPDLVDITGNLEITKPQSDERKS